VFRPGTAPMDFDIFKNKYDLNLIASMAASFKEDVILALDIENDFKFEIVRCQQALLFWEKTPGKKGIHKEEFIINSILRGPSYAEEISDRFEFGLRRFHELIIGSSRYSNWEEVDNYNFFPPVFYLLRWKEYSDDIKWMNEPLQFDKSKLKEFRKVLRSILPEDISPPSDAEILSFTKTSSSLCLENRKTIPMFKARTGKNGKRFSPIFKGKRHIIQVGPANLRDSVITSIDTYNSIKWCDLVTLEILNTLDESLVSSFPDKLNKSISKMVNNPYLSNVYWLRDIKKCGLTIPRQLIHIIQEELERKYPLIDFSRFNIFRDFSLYMEDFSPLACLRGVGQGMANNCVTLIQCVMYRMLIRRLPESVKVRGLFGNDDSILSLKIADWDDTIETCMLITELDDSILTGLGVIMNGKKSFWSKFPIIFENYGHSQFKLKESRLACALSSAMLAPNIRYAKILVNSLSSAFVEGESWLTDSLSTIIAKWGYEFYPGESPRDYYLGGWFSKNSRGCSTLLREVLSIDKEDELRHAQRSFRIIKKFESSLIKPTTSSDVSENYSVLGQIYGIRSIFPEDSNPIEPSVLSMIAIDKKGYEDFYQRLYDFKRKPEKAMMYLDKVYQSIRIPRESSSKEDFLVEIQSMGIPLAIPREYVFSETTVYQASEESTDLGFFFTRNALSRYLEYLRRSKIILSNLDEIHGYSGKDYLLSKDYDNPRIGGPPITRYSSFAGEIPKEIYQFSTNEFLPIFEYVEEFDSFPLKISSRFPERPHIPRKILDIEFSSERQFNFIYEMYPFREDIESMAADILYTESTPCKVDEEKRNIPPDVDLCIRCQSGESGWAHDLITFHANEDCMACIAIDRTWRIGILANLEDDVDVRLEYRQMSMMIRKSNLELIKEWIPSADPHVLLFGEPEDFFDRDSGSEGDTGFDMFGDD